MTDDEQFISYVKQWITFW